MINVSRIGDTLLATPAIRAIARFWPGAEIDVFGHPTRLEVLYALPFLRRVGGISKRSAWYRGWLGNFVKPYDPVFVYGFDSALVRYALRLSKHLVAFRQHDNDLNRRLWTEV